MWITWVSWLLLGVCALVAVVAAAVSSGRWPVTMGDPYPGDRENPDPFVDHVMESRVTPDIEWVPKSSTPGRAGDDTPATGAGASREEE
ncbi:hypothetical protein IM660_05665 [Ruania alkalisoli]|uniref:Uncharacterized protein n=1 Tax=Ruania alkalisoli TaxID=2779775 RepID=A0A7M1SWA7_9MICO|nr:hypothetical protein [Ruania alkalisoli]QOR71761.1 hypothetical protein IM660_05665 [Ruania alkalisoli]